MSRIAIQDISPPPDEQAMLLYERRRKIHTRMVPGRFRNLRLVAGLFVMLLYLLIPWLSIDGRQAVWFDLPARQFHILWLTFQPQDLILLSALLMILAFALFLVTTLWGRVWCGYTCPQTLWSFLFMWVERNIEGDRNQRIRLDAQPMAPQAAGRNRQGWKKLGQRSLKHLLWLLMALITGATFIAYFYGAHALLHDAWQWQLPLLVVAWTIFFTLATYINAGWLREHVCIYICPYARFQSVMFDDDTLTVSYDQGRGEPRGSRRRDNRDSSLGDCIDCQLCVQVCPTGIDIRDGLQYRCIDCAACIDACDTVMDKMQYARGLIGYRTLREPDGTARLNRLLKNVGEAVDARRKRAKKRSLHAVNEHSEPAFNEAATTQVVFQQPVKGLRPKPLIYTLALLAAVTLFSWQLTQRTALYLDVSRDRGDLFQLAGENLIQNSFSLQLRNPSREAQQVHIEVRGLDPVTVIPQQPEVLPAGESRLLSMRVQTALDALPSGNIVIEFVALDAEGRVLQRTESRFIGPNRP